MVIIIILPSYGTTVVSAVRSCQKRLCASHTCICFTKEYKFLRCT